jgi:hypothetical protein
MMSRKQRLIGWAVSLIIAQWLLMAMIVPLPKGEPFDALEYACVGFIFGTLFGQTTLAASWAVLGPGRLIWRLSLSLVWIGLLTLALRGSLGSVSPGAAGNALIIGACLFGQWIIVETLLWPLAIGFGLRLRHAGDLAFSPYQRERQFGIRDLLIITSLLGVIFAIGRRLIKELSGWPQFNTGMLIAVFLAVAAIVLTLPLLLAGLLPRRAALVVLLVMTLIGFATAWEGALVQFISKPPLRGPDFGHLIGINAFTAATILGGVAVLRLNGFSIGGRQKRTE